MPEPVKVKTRRRAGSWPSFEKRYVPIMNGETIERTWDDPAILQCKDDRFVWTIVDSDGNFSLVPGYATVNFHSRVLCTNPWADEELASPGYTY